LRERCFVNVVGRGGLMYVARGTIMPLRVELKPFERIVIGETVWSIPVRVRVS